MIWLPASTPTRRIAAAHDSIPGDSESHDVYPHPDSFMDLESAELRARAEDAELTSRNLYLAADGPDAMPVASTRSRNPADSGGRTVRADGSRADRGRVLELEVVALSDDAAVRG